MRRCLFRIIQARKRLHVMCHSLEPHDEMRLCVVPDVVYRDVPLPMLMVLLEALEVGLVVDVDAAVADVVVLVEVVLPRLRWEAHNACVMVR